MYKMLALTLTLLLVCLSITHATEDAVSQDDMSDVGKSLNITLNHEEK